MGAKHLTKLNNCLIPQGKVCSHHISTLRYFNLVIDMKHGLSNTRLYGIWREMKRRCYCNTCKSYPNYGGRGIIVCDEWLNDFQSFYKWATSNGYVESLSIERKDVNGNYEPSNCKWATIKEQANNKRNNHFITIDGEIMTVAQCVEKTGINETTLHYRLRNNKYDGSEVISIPVQHAHFIEHNGMVKTLRQWSICTGISYATLYCRLYKYNWDIERALTTR